jgi:methylisocitrate lyase
MSIRRLTDLRGWRWWGNEMNSAGARLRKLLARGFVAMPGAFNAATARLVARAGFDAVYVSGAGLCNATAGVPDIGLLSREEVALLAGYAAAAVKVPVIVDADTGWDDPAETVRALEKAGLAGMHIEDQSTDKRCGHLAGKKLISVERMAKKIRACVKGRRETGFFVIARTDARAVEGFDGAVERARAYLDAGADAIFPEALQTAEEFAAFAKRVQAPLLANMTEFGKSPLLSVKELARLGFHMAIFPQTAFRVAMKAEAACLADLRRYGTQKKWLGKMQTRAELYELLEYDPKAKNLKG